MKALCYKEPGTACLTEVEIPQITSVQALGKTVVSNVSAGTEMAFYRGTRHN